MPKKTASSSLQLYLESLLPLTTSRDQIPAFVALFVPLDLTPEESKMFIDDLSEDSKASRQQWEGLVQDIQSIAAGDRTSKIEETESKDGQTGRAVFFFDHPGSGLEAIDREVGFVKVGGVWRAEA